MTDTMKKIRIELKNLTEILSDTRYFVSSDILGYGTYAKMRSDAEKIMKSLIAHGGTDARIEYDPLQ